MKLRNPFKPTPAPPAFAKGQTLPESDANWLSRLVFHWVSPLLDVGFSRPLQKDDLWTLPESQLSSSITDQVEKNFYRRCAPQNRPRHLRDQYPDAETISSDASSHTAEDVKEKEEPPSADSKKSKGRYDSSLARALHRTFFTRIWTAGLFKLTSDTLKTTTPLVSKVLLTWLTESYAWYHLTEEQRAISGHKQPRGIGYGIGLSIAIFTMQEVASLTANHYQQITAINGLRIRTGLIGIIFRKSLRLSGRARNEHSVGKVTTMISTDATRLDRFSFFGHNLWVAPIQLAIGIGLLIGNLGYSALVGLGVLILGFPIQTILVKIMFTQRAKGVKITDTRVRLINEVLQGIRLVKFFAWEDFYAHQIGDLRRREIKTIKTATISRSALIALLTFTPAIATVLSFITYSLSGHDLNIAIIFSSLQFFNVLRFPLMLLPFVLSAFADALVALRRISSFLTAEELPEPYPIEDERKYAIEIDGDFTWETAGKIEESKFNVGKSAKAHGAQQKKGKGVKKGKETNAKSDATLPVTADDDQDSKEKDGQATPKQEEKPFELMNLKLNIPRGAFIAIVGPVGCGKSSVLQALIGEMRKTKGTVTFGGSVAYVPQAAWIKNATVRDNILFSQPDDEARFREVVRACNLEHDLEMFPDGETTEIGEKGINLSGGQKARVSLARAAYSQSEIVLLDDPLSAVDAYVGKAILENCLVSGPLADRTRILVTHALHVLDKTDYIYVMDHGQIAEQGTFDSLMRDSVIFARLMDEYGNSEKETEDDEDKDDEAKKDDGGAKNAKEGMDKDADALMQVEERNTGSVEWNIYAEYLRFGGGLIWAPVIFVLLAAAQGAQVTNNLFLGFWTSSEFPNFTQGAYMGVYAGLGVAQAVLFGVLSASFAFTNLRASLNSFRSALSAVLKSPVSFFDTTPIGRIMSRLSKDQDTLDIELSTTMFQFMSTFSSVLGTIALVFYTFPYLGIIFAPMTILYLIISTYYRRTSVETKRLDSVLRSTLYSAYSESLTGLPTIRAYRFQERSIRDADHGIDLQNRAYYMIITTQRWLALRLDLFANVLVLGIGLFAAGFRTSVNPAKIGVVLSYTLAIAQQFSEMVSQFAQNEQNMNAVERVLHYTKLPPEGRKQPSEDPPTNWPAKGGITFKNVELAYREGLPSVLKGVSFEVRPGEKVGIVGRTGAGKSSLLQALFRTVETTAGSIEIDGIDIANIDLYTLRRRLALVPQDSILFLGTLRENLDPENTRTDAEMISVLQRAWLLPRDGTPDPVAEAKFSLDATVGDEGSNFSAGEKQLLALCRALVKNSQIIVLDEATSSVDVETDAKLQRTIQTEFSAATLLCIAHRLNTIAYYDRILVMNEGQVAEFDTVLNLFDKEDSIFRSLCNEASLTRADIIKIREQHDKQQYFSGDAELTST